MKTLKEYLNIAINEKLVDVDPYHGEDFISSDIDGNFDRVKKNIGTLLSFLGEPDTFINLQKEMSYYKKQYENMYNSADKFKMKFTSLVPLQYIMCIAYTSAKKLDRELNNNKDYDFESIIENLWSLFEKNWLPEKEEFEKRAKKIKNREDQDHALRFLEASIKNLEKMKNELKSENFFETENIVNKNNLDKLKENCRKMYMNLYYYLQSIEFKK